MQKIILGLIGVVLLAGLFAVRAYDLNRPPRSNPPDSVTATSTGGSSSSSASTSTGGGILPFREGTRGIVLLGPTCPVQRVGDDRCADKPYATTVNVYRASDPSRLFASVLTGSQGKFEMSLAPGEYVFQAVGKNPLPGCGTQAVTVMPGEYRDITLSCDTGIR